MNPAAQFEDFFGSEKWESRHRSGANNFSIRIEQGGDHVELFAQVVKVAGAAAAILGDDVGASAEPAEISAERQMKIERKRSVTLGWGVVGLDVGQQRLPGDLFIKVRGCRIRSIPRARDIVFTN